MPSLTLSTLSLVLAAISLAIWAVLTFFRGSFWQLRRFDDDIVAHANLGNWPSVIAVIPARNESETIAQTIDSLLAQSYGGALRIIVVDDHSEDATAEIVRRKAVGMPTKLFLVSAAELPAGWTGKLWALQNGSVRAAQFAPEFFWFTDADIVHAPDTLQRLVSRAEDVRLDLVSLMVLLHAETFAERLLIPAFLYFFLQLYPPAWIAQRTAHTAGAAGGCVLLRRSALERIGGLATIRGEVIDDCALARAVKRGNNGIWMGVTRQSISLRVYQSFGEIRDMIARTAYTQLKYSPLILFGTLLGLLATYIVPIVFVFNAQPAVWRMALAAWALMAFTYLPTVRFYKRSPVWALLLPLAAAFYTYATWLSAVRYWMGRGGQWKGRAQAPALK